MESCCKQENVTESAAKEVQVHIHGHTVVVTDDNDTIETIKAKALNQITPGDLNFQIDVQKT